MCYYVYNKKTDSYRNEKTEARVNTAQVIFSHSLDSYNIHSWGTYDTHSQAYDSHILWVTNNHNRDLEYLHN